MPRRNRDVEATLINKFDFRPAQNRSRDHRWVELSVPGLPVIATFFSHAKQDIHGHLWAQIARQLRVARRYLDGMIDCTNSREDYYRALADAPPPPWNQRKP